MIPCGLCGEQNHCTEFHESVRRYPDYETMHAAVRARRITENHDPGDEDR